MIQIIILHEPKSCLTNENIIAIERWTKMIASFSCHDLKFLCNEQANEQAHFMPFVGKLLSDSYKKRKTKMAKKMEKSVWFGITFSHILSVIHELAGRFFKYSGNLFVVRHWWCHLISAKILNRQQSDGDTNSTNSNDCDFCQRQPNEVVVGITMA